MVVLITAATAAENDVVGPVMIAGPMKSGTGGRTDGFHAGSEREQFSSEVLFQSFAVISSDVRLVNNDDSVVPTE